MKHLSLLVPFFVLCHGLFAQVTTSTISGTVVDEISEPLIGATVVALHEPTGINYGTTTRPDGGFTLPNLRVGGPYTVSVSYLGYADAQHKEIFLALGETRKLSFSLVPAATEIEEVVVTAEYEIISKDRTGAETNVDSELFRTLPSINRSAADFTRLTPASDGFSFAGRNDQFNNFSLDGSIFTNPFGLDAATPGGQTESQPISLDAIDQINVAIAPYDVTQAGFTGANVNAVTKSGTNTFHGTVFGFWRNDGLTGKQVEDTRLPSADLRQIQGGFSLGGPIVKNKLFFFVNAEVDNRRDLGTTWIPAGADTDGQVSRVDVNDMILVANALESRFGYISGSYFGYTHDTKSVKGLAKLDWAINPKHTVTATYNFLDASKEKPAHPSALGRRGPDFITLQMENSGYRIDNVIHSGIIELRSVFGNKFSNKLQVGYTAFRDSRDPFSQPFPVININKDANRYIVAGHEPFSIHNRLNQDVYQATNNFKMYAGDHTFTFGTSFEAFLFDNSFNLDAYGGTFGPGYESVESFLQSVANGDLDQTVQDARDLFEANGGDSGVEGEGWALAETNVGQLAFYVQDDWNLRENLSLTLGLRVDIPLYFNTSEKIQENIDRNCCYEPDIVWYDESGNPVQFDHTVLPKQTPLFSPRFGFNWDVSSDQVTQLRGGTGLFSGRLPFVWIGNQVANPNFFFYNYTATDYKFPQVWRTNIGVDRKFGESWIATVDVIYTKDIHASMVRNYGLKPPTGTLQGVDNRQVYTNEDRVQFAGGPVNAYVFSNTDIGSSLNIGFQLRKEFNRDFTAMVAYNYLKAEDASSIEAEISSDAYERNPALGHVNTAVSAPSLYGATHRVIGSGTKTFRYGKNKSISTSIGVFFQYAQGGTTQNDNVADFRFTYTYSGDINNDGSALNDLIYIPTEGELDQMQFETSEQREAFREYIKQDEYLSANRGSYAEKYGILAPWYSQWDVRVMQEFSIGSGPDANRVQLTFDIINFGNLLSSSWGVRQLPNNSQILGVSVGSNGVPTYSFDTALKSTFSPDLSLASRWQGQLGLRYIF